MEFHQIFLGTISPTFNHVDDWLWESYPRLTNAHREEFLECYLPPGATVKECIRQRYLHSPFSTRDALSRYVDVAIAGEVNAGRGTPNGGVFAELTNPSFRVGSDVLEWYRYRGIR